MSFLTPLFLLGALAIAIPVILHFINFKKPNKQAFSTLVFFQKLQKSSIKWLILKKRLLLLLRIIAIILLSLALARPLLSPTLSAITPDSGNTLYAVIIENGPAMSQIDERGLLQNTANAAIESLIQNAKATDRFLIYNTHGVLLSPEELSGSQAARIINQIEPTNAGNFTSERISKLVDKAMRTQLEAIGMFFVMRGAEQLEEQMKHVILPEGFRKGLFPLTIITTGEAPERNTGITSVEIASRIVSRGAPLSVMVSVQNFSDHRVVNHFLSLEVNGQLETQFQVDLDAQESRTYTFEIIAPMHGQLKGRAILEGDAFSFDNSRYFVVSIPDRTKILLISDTQFSGNHRSWLNTVFRAATRSNSDLDVANATWDDWNTLNVNEYNAIILDGVYQIPEFAWNELQNFTQNGGGLVLVPGNKGNPTSLNPFLKRMNVGEFTGMMGEQGRSEPVASVDRIIRGHPIYEDIFQVNNEEELRLDLPILFHYWRYQASSRGGHIIMRTNLDDPLLISETAGNGRFIIATTSPDPAWSSFAVNPLFAPLFLRIGLYAAAGEFGAFNEFTLGEQFSIIKRGLHRNASLVLNNINLVPDIHIQARDTRLTSETYAWKPGWATLVASEDTSLIAVNQNTLESSFNILNLNTLDDIFSSLFQVSRVLNLKGLSEQEIIRSIGITAKGREVWRWFIIASILILVTESLVAARLKQKYD